MTHLVVFGVGSAILLFMTPAQLERLRRFEYGVQCFVDRVAELLQYEELDATETRDVIVDTVNDLIDDLKFQLIDQTNL